MCHWLWSSSSLRNAWCTNPIDYRIHLLTWDSGQLKEDALSKVVLLKREGRRRGVEAGEAVLGHGRIWGLDLLGRLAAQSEKMWRNPGWLG